MVEGGCGIWRLPWPGFKSWLCCVTMRPVVSFIQCVFNKHLLCARHWFSHWRENMKEGLSEAASEQRPKGAEKCTLCMCGGNSQAERAVCAKGLGQDPGCWKNS